MKQFSNVWQDLGYLQPAAAFPSQSHLHFYIPELIYLLTFPLCPDQSWEALTEPCSSPSPRFLPASLPCHPPLELFLPFLVFKSPVALVYSNNKYLFQYIPHFKLFHTFCSSQAPCPLWFSVLEIPAVGTEERPLHVLHPSRGAVRTPLVALCTSLKFLFLHEVRQGQKIQKFHVCYGEKHHQKKN